MSIKAPLHSKHWHFHNQKLNLHKKYINETKSIIVKKIYNTKKEKLKHLPLISRVLTAD